MESVLCFCSKHGCGKTPHQASVCPAIRLATELTEKREGWRGVPFLNKFRFFSSKRSRCPAPLMTSDPGRRSYWSGWRGLLKLTIEEGLGKWPDGGEGWLNGVTAQKDRGVQEGEGCLVAVCVCVCHGVKNFPLSGPLLPLLVSTSVSPQLLWLWATAGQKASNKPALNNVWPLLFLACLSSATLHRNLLASFVLICLIQRLVSLFPLFYMLFSGFSFYFFFSPPPSPAAKVSSGILCGVRVQRASWLDATH